MGFSERMAAMENSARRGTVMGINPQQRLLVAIAGAHLHATAAHQRPIELLERMSG